MLLALSFHCYLSSSLRFCHCSPINFALCIKSEEPTLLYTFPSFKILFLNKKNPLSPFFLPLGSFPPVFLIFKVLPLAIFLLLIFSSRTFFTLMSFDLELTLFATLSSPAGFGFEELELYTGLPYPNGGGFGYQHPVYICWKVTIVWILESWSSNLSRMVIICDCSC